MRRRGVPVTFVVPHTSLQRTPKQVSRARPSRSYLADPLEFVVFGVVTGMYRAGGPDKIAAWQILDHREYPRAEYRGWDTRTPRSLWIVWRGFSQRQRAWLWTCQAAPVGI
jgi:hypothetical protein